jgi:hypothetical protein
MRVRSCRNGITATAARLAIAMAIALCGACQAMVIEPLDESAFSQSNIKFWGYTTSPGQQVRLEAQSTTWEVLSTSTTSTVPTRSAGYTGYYYELWAYGPSVATRFRKTSPYASSGYWRTFFRVTTASGGIATTRQYQPNTTPSGSTNWLEKFWLDHTAPNSPLRIDIHP